MLQTINTKIIKAYDIRGVYKDDLNEADAYTLGALIASSNITKQNIYIGRDARLSSKSLRDAIVKGIIDYGSAVIDLGIIPTPTLYVNAISKPCYIGVMITGSHNPKNHNGFKILRNKKPLYGQELKAFCNQSLDSIFPSKAKGVVMQMNVIDDYINKICSLVNIKSQNIKVVIDPSHGPASIVLTKLIRQLPGEYTIINQDIDGNFPSHGPDPTNHQNLEQLSKAVLSHKADFGIAFDGDADRVVIIDENAEVVSSEALLAIFANDLQRRYSDIKVACDVKTSDFAIQNIQALGVQVLLSKTGHSHIKQLMQDEHLLLAAEASGHIYLAENYYKIDDAILAAFKFIEIYSNANLRASQLHKSYLYHCFAYEAKLPIDELSKQSFIENSVLICKKLNLVYNGLDGVRVSTKDGWFLVRLSNTENVITVKAEATSKEKLKEFKSIITKLSSYN